MTLIVDVLARVARQVSITAPSSWLTASEDEHVEIRDDFLLEAVDDILEGVDLPAPMGASVAVSTLTSATNSDGSRTFELPAAFKRLHRDPMSVYDPLLNERCVPVTTEGEWTALTDDGAAGVVRYYRLSGYLGAHEVTFYADPGASATITVAYNTVNWMANSGTAGSAFTSADDVLILPRRLVESGIVWRWRERKGLPYDDKMAEYEMLKARLANDSRPRRIVNMAGGGDHIRWQDRVPAYIPSA
jgi:hypothetical protein